MAEPRLFEQSSLQPRLEQAFDFAARQVRLTVERTPDYFPIFTVGGRWLQRGELWTDWCGGFYAGMMWLIAGRTSESWWRQTAEHYSGLLEHRQHDRNVHPETGQFLRESTHQGLRPDSAWTRGLAWSLYGFSKVVSYTQDPADLEVSRRNAEYYLARCPANLVPPWDFDVPEGPDQIDDSSAAAIAASGLWDLARFMDSVDPSLAVSYRAVPLTILDTLCTDHYLAWNDPSWEGVLKHGVHHYHKELGVDESVMWGDFFFLEAVDKALNWLDEPVGP